MARERIKLRAPTGADEVNQGTTSYRVDNDHTVTVPPEVAEILLHQAGYSEAEPEQFAIPDGSVLMRHTDNTASCSFNGMTFAADEFGKVVVPLAAAHSLAAHGFVLVDENDEPELTPAPAVIEPEVRAEDAGISESAGGSDHGE